MFSKAGYDAPIFYRSTPVFAGFSIAIIVTKSQLASATLSIAVTLFVVGNHVILYIGPLIRHDYFRNIRALKSEAIRCCNCVAMILRNILWHTQYFHYRSPSGTVSRSEFKIIRKHGAEKAYLLLPSATATRHTPSTRNASTFPLNLYFPPTY